ncbi:hypothetical protein ACSQ76_21925 [Roseovarius sp. B08]|uniref:hypothetical protein n=1 Tax=Roseovarius sp. B08 TaxID=3449223 RepID=UPI003EDC9D81
MTVFASASSNLQTQRFHLARSIASTWSSYTSSRGKTLHCRMPRRQNGLARHDLIPGDIVSFRFPYLDEREEGVSGPLPNARPCLVAEVDPETESALIVYGTSRWTRANTGYELRVNHDLNACGLSRPTRFVFSRRVRVSLCDQRFELLAHGMPVTGHLPKLLMARMTWLLSLISSKYDGDEELRHVHEWLGANEIKDRDIVGKLMRGNAHVVS